MKLFLGLFAASLWISPSAFAQGDFRDGDIVFIKNKETKGKSLLPNGKSKFNYIGIIFVENGAPVVYHSMEPLSKTPIKDFVALSEGEEFAIKHLAEEELLTEKAVHTMHNFATAKLGSAYDNSLTLSSEAVYNAEFVWKIYQLGTELELCIPRQIKEYKVDNPAAIDFLKDAYGEAFLNEKIVSVGDIFQSQFLE